MGVWGVPGWGCPGGVSARAAGPIRCLRRALNSSEVEALGIRMLPGYRDPYHGRPLTRGELGCFLSHYRVWQEVRGGGGANPGEDGGETLILIGMRGRETLIRIGMRRGRP